MEERISVFSNLKNEVVITVRNYIKIPKDGYDLLIVPDTGAWIALSKSDTYILDYLLKPITVLELKNNSECRTEVLIDDLFYSGIVRINDKDIFDIKQQEVQEFRLNVPRLWILKYTNACNLRCSYCYSYDKRLNNCVKMPNEYVYKVSELVGSTSEEHKLCFCFHGGEPLTRFNDIKECVAELRKRRKDDVEFAIQTNGTLMSPQIAEYLKKEHISVGISIDGFDEETNKLRPFANYRSSVNATLNAIKYCLEAGITPGIISVMTSNICEKTIDIMDNLAKLGIKSFHFNHFFPSGRSENKEKDYSVPISEILDIRIKMLLYINDYNAKKEKKDHISERYIKNLIRNLSTIGQLHYMCAQSPCGAGTKILSMSYNGDLYPCDDFGLTPSFKIGNINEIDNLNNVLKKSEVVKKCQAHCVDNTPECKICPLKRICISHCCSDSFHYTGRFNRPHSACGFIKQFIPQVIDLLYKGRIHVENLID